MEVKNVTGGGVQQYLVACCFGLASGESPTMTTSAGEGGMPHRRGTAKDMLLRLAVLSTLCGAAKPSGFTPSLGNADLGDSSASTTAVLKGELQYKASRSVGARAPLPPRMPIAGSTARFC